MSAAPGGAPLRRTPALEGAPVEKIPGHLPAKERRAPHNPGGPWGLGWGLRGKRTTAEAHSVSGPRCSQYVLPRGPCASNPRGTEHHLPPGAGSSEGRPRTLRMTEPPPGTLPGAGSQGQRERGRASGLRLVREAAGPSG